MAFRRGHSFLFVIFQTIENSSFCSLLERSDQLKPHSTQLSENETFRFHLRSLPSILTFIILTVYSYLTIR